ncbi:uncharacterized protein LOC128959349 [Oppia nitens]|uniref:uncharacterized protein LOC128959349 n=1 Tax=Oppia nitens TaxID=1686743 RepID=UPI0023DB89EA|nr:uncharacterized protein LOC128959349 [Oppia nitens]
MVYKCECPDDSYFVKGIARCVENNGNNESRTAMQIYKITMIFASCCLALILIIFLVCILRKSYCPPASAAGRSRMPNGPLDNRTIPDIFTLFPHCGNYDGGPLGDGTLPPFEKPPTYDETLTLIRNQIGVPPPAYRGRNGTPYSSNPSTPELAARVHVQRPQLIAVTTTTTGSRHSASASPPLSLASASTSSSSFSANNSPPGLHSSRDELIAGPSGECSRRSAVATTSSGSGGAGGIDNPAFC